MTKKKKFQVSNFISRNLAGYTMVEMLIALLMGGIVVSAIYSLFMVQTSSQWLQDQIAEMQANARVAMERISYDIRMAGFNMIGGHQVSYMEAGGPIDPLQGTDGGADNPDRISLYYSPYAGADCGVPDLSLAGSIPVGATQLDINLLQDLTSAPYNAWITGFTCDGCAFSAPFKFIIVCDSQHGGCSAPVADVLLATGIETSPGRIINSQTMSSFPPNSQIKFFSEANFNGFTYSIDGSNRLLRYTSGAGGPADVFAENIEDIQLVYITNTGTEYSGTGALTVADIRAVRVTVLARTAQEDKELKLNTAANNTRPALENHNGSGIHDGYHRRVLSSVVQVRNFGI